jgi:uncharacterized protein
MAFAQLYIGDSQTMATEAAVLGVPALRYNSFAGKISVLKELENKYGLMFSYLPSEFNKLKEKLTEMLSMDNLKKEWQVRRMRMLEDKIDLTAFLAWFIENYPQSRNMNNTPEFLKIFK